VANDFAQLGHPPTVIIPNGISLPSSGAAGRVAQLRADLALNGRLLVLVTATNFYLKGVMTVLRALARMDRATRRRFCVLITGHGCAHNRDPVFARFIREHELTDCCRLTGWVEDIAGYYQAADIFLHPTYHDAGSLSTLKALAAGCAVITSRFDGSADYIHDGLDGLVLARPGDPEELAAALRRLLDDSLRQRLGHAARQLAPALRQENQFQRLETLYRELLAPPSRPPP